MFTLRIFNHLGISFPRPSATFSWYKLILLTRNFSICGYHIFKIQSWDFLAFNQPFSRICSFNCSSRCSPTKSFYLLLRLQIKIIPATACISHSTIKSTRCRLQEKPSASRSLLLRTLSLMLWKLNMILILLMMSQIVITIHRSIIIACIIIIRRNLIQLMNSNLLQLAFRFFRGWSITGHWWIHSRKRRWWITLQIHNMIRLILRQSYIIITAWVRRIFSKSIRSRCHRYKLSTFLIDEVVRYWYDNTILIFVALRCFSPLLMLSACFWIRLLLLICIGWCRWCKICQSFKCVIFEANISCFVKFFIYGIVIFVATVVVVDVIGVTIVVSTHFVVLRG